MLWAPFATEAQMTPEAQLALINNIVPILTALVSLIGAIAAILGWQKSTHNSRDLKEAKDGLADNTAKTEDVGRAVNGRVESLLEEIKRSNQEALAKAVETARLDAEKIALTHIGELKAQLAASQTKAETVEALRVLEAKLAAATEGK